MWHQQISCADAAMQLRHFPAVLGSGSAAAHSSHVVFQRPRFMGPLFGDSTSFESSKPPESRGIKGIRRFLVGSSRQQGFASSSWITVAFSAALGCNSEAWEFALSFICSLGSAGCVSIGWEEVVECSRCKWIGKMDLLQGRCRTNQ